MDKVVTAPKGLRQRKRQWVSRMIRESAMTLFAQNGYDETTMDQIAEAAGVSRRSLFRYFAGRDDLFGHEIVTYGAAMSELIAESPADSTPLELVSRTALRLAELAESEPMTRNVVGILLNSLNARQAQASRLPDARDKVAAAFAKKLNLRRKGDMRAELLAALSFSIIEVATRSWYLGHHSRLSVAVDQALRATLQLSERPGDPGARPAKQDQIKRTKAAKKS